MHRRLSLMLFLLLAGATTVAWSQDQAPALDQPLSQTHVSALAKLAFNALDREYPNKPANVMTGPETVLSPRQMHPAFYGCFDWHSSVHGHWMLVRVLKLYPQVEDQERIRARLDEHLRARNIEQEAAYFNERENHSFERMYGWAWLLRLAAELHTWDDVDGQRWRNNLRPLEARIVELTRAYIPRLSFPIRTGVHPDTAFALGQILDYARLVGDPPLEAMIVQRSRDFFGDDRDYPAEYEPSGEDFFSPGWNEADLMRRVLSGPEFSSWLQRFLPLLGGAATPRMMQPVEVTDVTDGKLVHLAGLDLSRAWAMQGVASALPSSDPRTAPLQQAAAAHADAGFKYVFSGHYEGEHWLATFALYLHTAAGLPTPSGSQ